MLLKLPESQGEYPRNKTLSGVEIEQLMVRPFERVLNLLYLIRPVVTHTVLVKD